ncbi:MAG: hypothetical protein KTR21_14800 [Rhodobacteraceae bacterium]|nr:hypothetical protein [Paracoccaceae bacterium]
MRLEVTLDAQRGPGRQFSVRRTDDKPALDQANAKALAIMATLNLFSDDSCLGRDRLEPVRAWHVALNNGYIVEAECRS